MIGDYYGLSPTACYLVVSSPTSLPTTTKYKYFCLFGRYAGGQGPRDPAMNTDAVARAFP